MNISQVKNMKNKFTITEEEKCRILNLHESAILKENNLLNENTVALSASENSFSPYGSWSRDPLLLYKGTTFKVSPTIPNSLVTTTKVEANLVQYGTFGLSVYAKPNKAFVVCDCNNKTLYLSGMTDKRNDGKDIKNNSKARWILGNNMLSMINLCKTATAIKPVDVVTPPKEETKFKEIKIVGKRKKDKKTYIAGTKGDKYTFDFDAVMKAIDDTGKCSKDKSNDLNPDCSSKCSEQPKVVPPGSIVAQYQGYFYDSIQGKCIEVTGQSGPFGSTDECEKCNCGGKDPVGDKVKSGLNNDVDPVNTKISDELYYKIIAP